MTKKKKKNHPRVGVLRILGVLFHFAINFFIVVYKNISLWQIENKNKTGPSLQTLKIIANSKTVEWKLSLFSEMCE